MKFLGIAILVFFNICNKILNKLGNKKKIFLFLYFKSYTLLIHTMKSKSTKLVFLLLLFATFEIFAQNAGRKLYPGSSRTRAVGKAPIYSKIAYPWTYTLGIGRTSYLGSLCPDGDCLFGFHALDFTVNFGLKYRFTPRISVGGTIRYFGVSGSDAESGTKGGGMRTGRNLSFKTDALEIMAVGQFDFIPIINKFLGEKEDQYNRRNIVVPYGLVGFGMVYFSPTARTGDDAAKYGLDPNTTYSLRKLITSEEKQRGSFYSPIVPVFMFGVGVQVKLTEYLDLGLDLQLQKPFTENLDDVDPNSKYPTWNGMTYNDAKNMYPSLTPEDYYFADRSLGQRIDTKDDNPGNDYRGGNPETLDRKLSKSSSRDNYFLFNFKICYTVSNFLKPWDPAHKHFRGGKGSKHHHFNAK